MLIDSFLSLKQEKQLEIHSWLKLKTLIPVYYNRQLHSYPGHGHAMFPIAVSCDSGLNSCEGDNI